MPTSPRRFLFTATDASVQVRLLRVAHVLRANGHAVAWFATVPREAALLRAAGEPVLVPGNHRVGSPSAGVAEKLPERIERALAFRALVGGLRPGRRLRTRAHEILAGAREATEDHDATDVLVWNGADLQAAAAITAAGEFSCRTWFAENGLFADTLQLDPLGVNAASRAAGLLRAAEGDALPPSPWSRAEEDALAVRLAAVVDRALGDEGERAARHLGMDPSDRARGQAQNAPRSLSARPSRGYARWLRMLEARDTLLAPERAPCGLAERLRRSYGAHVLRRRPLPGDHAELPDSFVFLPLQVHDDTQVLTHGRWVDSMATLCANVRRAADALGLPVVAREHPADLGRIDHRALRRAFPSFLWTRTRPLAPCLRAARAVVTVNSTVGLEALVAGTPVVCCGDAIYEHPALAASARSPEELRTALAAACERRDAMSPDAQRAALAWIQETLHVPAPRSPTAPDAWTAACRTAARLLVAVSGSPTPQMLDHGREGEPPSPHDESAGASPTSRLAASNPRGS
jgi:hypothetical protein